MSNVRSMCLVGQHDALRMLDAFPSVAGRNEQTTTQYSSLASQNSRGYATSEGFCDGWSKFLVPGEGFDPSRGPPRRILSAVRLPFRHPGRRIAGNFIAHSDVRAWAL